MLESVLRAFAFISNNLGNILATISILAAVIALVLQAKKKEKKTMKKMLGICVAVCLFLFLATVIAKQFTYVPNVIGLSYNSAIEYMTERDIVPQFVLLSSVDIKSDDCRVSWQSKTGNTLTRKSTICYLLLDDNYYSKSAQVIAINPFKYFFYYLDYDYQVVEDYSFDAQIVLSRTKRMGHSSKLILGSNSADDSYNEFLSRNILYCISELLSVAKEKTITLVYDDKNFVETLYEVAEINDCDYLICKIVPESKSHVRYEEYRVQVSGDMWDVYIPHEILFGDYQIYVCGISENGLWYEWEVPFIVEP